MTVNVGTFRGGTTKNTVPAGRVRGGPALPHAGGRRGASWRARDGGPRGGGRGDAPRGRAPRRRPPLERTAASAALAEAYGACQREGGLGVGRGAARRRRLGRLTTGAIGVPSIDGLGPRGAGFHTRDEEVELASLVPKAEALVRFLDGRARP